MVHVYLSTGNGAGVFQYRPWGGVSWYRQWARYISVQAMEQVYKQVYFGTGNEADVSHCWPSGRCISVQIIRQVYCSTIHGTGVAQYRPSGSGILIQAM